MPSSGKDNPNWRNQANFLIGLKVPYRYRYLITPELVEEGAELLRKGQSFEVNIDENSLGAGFRVDITEGIGNLPGVSPQGISARGLITLVPKTR